MTVEPVCSSGSGVLRSEWTSSSALGGASVPSWGNRPTSGAGSRSASARRWLLEE